MTPKRALAITLIATTLLPLAQADTLGPSAPYPAIDMGRTTGGHSNGNLVSIASTSAANIAHLTFSTDGGLTWTDRNTNLNTGGARLEVIGYSATTFEIFWVSGNTLQGYRSTDGGVNWLLVYQDANGLTGSGTGMADFQDLGGGKFAYIGGANTFNCGQGCSNTGGWVLRYYNGVSFATVHSQTTGCIGFYGNSHTFLYASFWITSVISNIVTAGRVAYSSSSVNCGGTGALPVTQLMTNGAWGTQYQLDDASTPLSSRSGAVNVLPGDLGTLFSAGSPGKLFLAKPLAANTFTTCPTFVFSSQLLDSSVAGGRYAILTAEDANVPIAMWSSCDQGETWGRSVLESLGTHPAHADIVAVAGGTFLFPFRYGGTLGYYINDDETCPGNGLPFGGGSTNPTTTAYELKEIFCSLKSDPMFGYNYKEGVTQWDVDNGFQADANQIDHGFRFIGDANNYDYLAAAINPDTASTALRVYFRIESQASGATDDAGSVFRVGFSLMNHVEEDWLEADGDTLTADAKGNGGDSSDNPDGSGAFENSSKSGSGKSATTGTSRSTSTSAARATHSDAPTSETTPTMPTPTTSRSTLPNPTPTTRSAASSRTAPPSPSATAPWSKPSRPQPTPP